MNVEEDLEPFLNNSERIPGENRSDNNLVKLKRSTTRNTNHTAKKTLHRNSEHESQQYEQDESEIWWHHQLQRRVCIATSVHDDCFSFYSLFCLDTLKIRANGGHFQRRATFYVGC